MMKDKEPCHPECLGGEVQWGLERAFKGLLAASNDTVRFRRDAALMWRHVESARPALDREGARAMEELLVLQSHFRQAAVVVATRRWGQGQMRRLAFRP